MNRHRLISAGFLLAGLALWSPALWLHAKATLAQHLIADAWKTQSTPWEWADFHPAGRLHAPSLGEQWFVLSDASPRTLAFGPGVLSTSRSGGRMISGHNETSFARLADLQIGDQAVWQGEPGQAAQLLTVVDRDIVHYSAHNLQHALDSGQTLLVTCHTIAGSSASTPWRLVVALEPVETLLM